MVKEKTLKDYIDKVQEQFPFLCKKDINTILVYGLYMYEYANRQHCDVIFVRDRKYDSITTATGHIITDWQYFWFNWHTKWRMKERFLYRRQKKVWDGYYYIGMTEEEHKQFSKGGKRKTLRNKYLTKIRAEFHHFRSIKHVWRVPWPKEEGWKFFIDKLTSDQFEYVGSNEYTDYHQWTRKEEVNADNNQPIQQGVVDGSTSIDDSQHSTD